MIPDIKTQNEFKYFNAKFDEKDLRESFVPDNKKKKVQKYQQVFKDFDTSPSTK